MYINMCIYTRCTGERAYDIEYSEYEVLLYICRYVQHITTICVYVFNCQLFDSANDSDGL